MVAVGGHEKDGGADGNESHGGRFFGARGVVDVLKELLFRRPGRGGEAQRDGDRNSSTQKRIRWI
jgi:hypothetical protein